MGCLSGALLCLFYSCPSALFVPKATGAFNYETTRVSYPVTRIAWELRNGTSGNSVWYLAMIIFADFLSGKFL